MAQDGPEPKAPTVRARTTDPATSHEAAVRVEANETENVKSQEIVVGIIRAAGKALADFQIGPLFYEAKPEACDHLHKMARHWARKSGLVKCTGKKIINPDTNFKGFTWELGRDDKFLDFEAVTCECCGHKSRQPKEIPPPTVPPVFDGGLF